MIILFENKFILLVLIIYFIIISIVSVIVTIYDKIIAKKGGFRIPEASLLALSVLGGSVFMYITMRAIRHKTRHVKFMFGIPIIIISQIAILIYIIYRVWV